MVKKNFEFYWCLWFQLKTNKSVFEIEHRNRVSVWNRALSPPTFWPRRRQFRLSGWSEWFTLESVGHWFKLLFKNLMSKNRWWIFWLKFHFQMEFRNNCILIMYGNCIVEVYFCWNLNSCTNFEMHEEKTRFRFRIIRNISFHFKSKTEELLNTQHIL